MSAFRERIEEYIRRQARPLEKFGHQPRLYALTCEIGKSYDYDDDVVFAAAWLHDLGVFTGHRPEDPKELAVWDNTAYAMAKSPEILREVDFPEAKRKAVAEAIRTHQPGAAPTTVEGQILRDADILEQLGAIAVMRTVCKVGRDTRFPDFTAAAKSLRRALTNLPGQIRLEATQSLARRRAEVLEGFLRELEAETGGALY